MAPTAMTTGDVGRWTVLALFSDGSSSDISTDPGLAIGPSDPNVLAVFPNGTVEALAPGRAQIGRAHV